MEWWQGSLFALATMSAATINAACRLQKANDVNISPWTSCLDGHIGGYGLAINDTSNKRVGVKTLAEAYASLYASGWLSLHGKAYSRYSYQNARNFTRSSWQKTTEQAFLQLGHPMLHSLHGAFGRLPMPFGINQDLYKRVLTSRAQSYWDESVAGLRLSLRLREDLRFEAGGARKEKAALGSLETQVLALRLTKLTDLLSGTKLIASYQADSTYGTHKLGLAALVYNEENLSSLEWLRRNSNKDALEGKTNQVFRFVHQQNQEVWSWNLVYEDIRNESYRLSLGTTRRFVDTWTVSGSLHYERLRRVKAEHQVYFILGLSYGLSQSYEWGAPHAGT